MSEALRRLMPRMRLDDLPAELQVRLEAVLATRDRVHALLEAVVSVSSDLDLETVLRRIVKTATTLVDASYGLLGAIGEERTPVQFIPVGLSEEEIAAIEHWPHGLGLLGLLIKEPIRCGCRGSPTIPSPTAFRPATRRWARFSAFPFAYGTRFSETST